MARTLHLLFVFYCFLPSAAFASETEKGKVLPVQVRVGAYVTSLYELNPNNNTFIADFWLWFVHHGKQDIKPLKTLELENARDFKTSLEVSEDHGDQRYQAAKFHGVFNHGWNAEKFPFDRHELRISMSEGQAESSTLTYATDGGNTGIDPQIKIEGWRVEKVVIRTGEHKYDTTFGVPGETGGSTYASAVISIFIARDATGIFWKLMAAVYIAFIIGSVSFFMDPSKDSFFTGRLSLLAAMIFAVIINSSRVATSLGQNPSFTLADKIHILTLIFLLMATVASIISRKMHVSGKGAMALRLDRLMALVFFVAYSVINLTMITIAAY